MIKTKKIRSLFISYRRQDAAATAGRIADRLKHLFPKLNVFHDVDTIKGGENFSDKIFSSIEQSDVVICLIGNQWGITANGVNRLEEEVDYVRLEVETALKSNAVVYPILLNDTKMPNEDNLPKEIQTISTLNAMELRDSRFNDDLSHIVESIFSVSKSKQQKRFLPLLIRALVLGLPLGLFLVFMVAQLNHALTGSSLAYSLGSFMTTALIILFPTLCIFFIYQKIK
jgi:hypothetical protein